MTEIPRIRFDEVSVGSRPILPNVRNRIGIVGQFSRGPANQFAFVDGFTQFANIYGSDNELGSIGYKAAWDQGARDFGLVRVMGREKPATGSVIVSGNATKDNTLNFKFTGVQDIVLEVETSFDMPVVNTGSNYTGTATGHYVFVVTSVFPEGTVATTLPGETAAEEGTALIKYKFFPTTTAFSRLDAIAALTPAELLTITEITDDAGWASPTQGVIKLAINSTFDYAAAAYANLIDATALGDTSSNIAINLGQGINITFGEAPDVDLYFTADQKFTFFVDSYNYDIPIVAGETSVDIMNRITSTINGVDPLGDVDIDIQYLTNVNNNYQGTISFELDPNNPELAGSKGTAYDYVITLDTPDGSAYITNAAWADDDGGGVGSGLDSLYTTDLEAPDLVGMELSVIEGTNTVGDLTGPGVTVTSVVADTPVAGTYQINLSADLTVAVGALAAEGDYTALATPGNGPLMITFLNPLQSGFQVSGQGATQPFVGGVDGPQFASRIFYSLTGLRLIELSARSNGKWGNNLLVDIVPIDSTSYRINVTDSDGQNYDPPIVSESFVIDLTSTDALNDEGVIVALQDSNLIRGSFLPKVDNPTGFDVNLLRIKPERLAPVNAALAGANTDDPRHPSFFGPSRLTDVSLEGGSDGPLITEADYVEAIKLLDGQTVNYIFAPGIHTNFKAAQAQLVTVARNSTEVDGLKIAILNARPGLRPTQARTEFEHINSSRAICVAGWSSYAGSTGSGRFTLSPDALYAGKIATIGFAVSPAARSTSGPIVNITEVDTRPYTSRQSLQLYADGRMEAVVPDLNLGGFFFLNGFTSSSDSAWDRLIVRRTYDVIRQDLFLGLQSYKSEPHTALLRRQIETSINSYFSNLARNNKIANFVPAICNESNNPPENYITGELNVSIGFLPLYAADYINVSLSRNTEGGLEFGDIN